MKGASLYALDLATKTVKTLARGVGTVTAIDHRGGSVLLGTSEGLLEVDVDGLVTRHTLTGSADAAASIIDVEVVGATTLVTTTSQVLAARHARGGARRRHATLARRAHEGRQR